MAGRTKQCVNVAFIGGGLVAELHARAVKACDAAKLVGVFDTAPAAGKRFARRHRVCAYRSLDELLNDGSVQAVHVLTPPEAHLDTAMAALIAGKHVLVEKPVSHKAGDIRKIMRAAERRGCLAVPAHNYIHAPSLQRAKRLIDDGSLGPIAAFWMMYNMVHDRSQIKKYGSILRVVCVHHAYSLLYLLGRPRRVTAMATRAPHVPDVPHLAQVAITCNMPDGVIANLWASFAANDMTNAPWHVIYKLLGTNGGVNYSWDEAHTADRVPHRGSGSGMLGYVDSFRYEVDHFITRCILEGDAPLSTMSDALDALRIIEAAERAVRTGTTVQVKYDKPRR
ncbi:MAG: Gfo/Idh/MocA family oxidoreductase [Phycisphaeraceae bacterium]|nr:Gfo/Idh/MocA family oxidoreductase [Phycisphaeraceae bacterium]